jgi:plastocyanin
MRKFTLLAVPLLFVIVLAISGCGESSGGSGGSYSTPDVTMGQDNFDHSSLAISAGATVKFSSPSSAAPHILCVGENGHCATTASGPSELTGGNSMRVDPGETKSVTFATPGAYKIACTLHPMMTMTITVQ